MKLSIVFALAVVYACVIYLCRPIELSGRDELKRGLKNYTLITK